MLSPSDLTKEIETRLKNYLSRDKSGIRKALLSLIVKIGTVTVAQLHEALSKTFDVTYQSVASMVGIISSRFGILSQIKERDADLATYKLKDRYAAVVERVISAV